MGILRTDKISGLETPTAVTGSVVFDGTGDYLTIPINTEFEVGADFTFETWIYRTSLGSLNTIYSYLTAGTTLYGLSFILTTTGIGIYGYNDGDNNYDALLNINGVVSTNEWHHVAVVRSNSTWYYYIDGVLQGSGSMTSFSYTGTPTFYIGVQNDNFANAFTGYLSNYRVVKGKALYTSDFTPPVHALEPIDGTVLLCCNNPDSAGAEATGKTITVNGDAAASTVSPGLTRDFTFGTQFEGVSKFDTQGYFVPPSGTTEQRGRGRGLFGGGDPGTAKNNIDYITISSIGNAQDFGDLTEGRLGTGAVASSTRAVFAGGYLSPSPGNRDTMDFVTIASTGNATLFGELINSDRHELAGVSNSTRGLLAGGSTTSAPNHTNEIDSIVIASLGNSTDFGDLTVTRRNITGVMSSTRGVFCGGRTDTPAPSTQQNVIDFTTIASTGTVSNFGDLTVARGRMGSVCSSIRGVIAGGEGSPTDSLVIDFITIATTGNAQDFGDLSEAAETDSGGCSNGIRGVFGGVTTVRNTMEYVTISSTGNAQDFGDTTYSITRKTGCSDSHGGIS